MNSGETLMEVCSGSDVQISDVSFRIAGMVNFCFRVKRMIRGLRGVLPLTCSQTLIGYDPIVSLLNFGFQTPFRVGRFW